MVFPSELRDLTWQVEECVKDIKALCIISLDELVWVPFTDLRAGEKTRQELSEKSTKLTYSLMIRSLFQNMESENMNAGTLNSIQRGFIGTIKKCYQQRCVTVQHCD